jgi:hypothetical protein
VVAGAAVRVTGVVAGAAVRVTGVVAGAAVRVAGVAAGAAVRVTGVVAGAAVRVGVWAPANSASISTREATRPDTSARSAIIRRNFIVYVLLLG